MSAPTPPAVSLPNPASRAVFLSYASQDAEAARRICEALRAGGIVVWFDADGGLEHGDEWDRKIRRQIKECVLFIPLISANTQARLEGYFRIEWELAAERAVGIAAGVPFILPIIIDDTREPDALVPDRFRKVQWTKLPNGVVPPEVQARLLKVWSHRVGTLSHQAAAGLSGSAPTMVPVPPAVGGKWRWAAAAFLLVAVGGFWMWIQRGRAPAESATRIAEPPKSEAQKLADQARVLFLESKGGPPKLFAAVSIAAQALKLDPNNADALGLASQLDTHQLLWEDTPVRRERARSRQELAVNLAPRAREPRISRAWFLVLGLGPPQANQAEEDLLALRQELPTDWRLCWIPTLLRLQQGRREDAAEILEDGARRIPEWAIVALSQKAVLLHYLGRYPEAEQTIDRSLTSDASANGIAFKAGMELAWRGNPDGALAVASRMAIDDQFADIGMATFERVYRWRREPANVLKFLSQDAREWINWNVGAPKAALKGEAFQALGQLDSARAEWQLAVKQIDERLTATPNDRGFLEWKAYLLARLEARSEAQALWKRALGLPRLRPREMYYFEKIQALGTPDEILAELEARAERPSVPVPDATYVFISAAELRLNPAWDEVRELPRFKALQAKLGEDPRFSPTATAVTK